MQAPSPSPVVVSSPSPLTRWGDVALIATAYDLGVVLATVVLGAVEEWIGYRGIFGVAAAVMALGAGTAHVWGHR